MLIRETASRERGLARFRGGVEVNLHNPRSGARTGSLSLVAFALLPPTAMLRHQGRRREESSFVENQPPIDETPAKKQRPGLENEGGQGSHGFSSLRRPSAALIRVRVRVRLSSHGGKILNSDRADERFMKWSRGAEEQGAVYPAHHGRTAE